MPHHADAEDALESAVMQKLQELGYALVDAYDEISGQMVTGRETLDEVVLLHRLERALSEFNPTLPSAAIDAAIDLLTADRSIQSLVRANEHLYHIIKEGVKVTFKDDYGEEQTETVKVIDWNDLTTNDWLAVQQLWVMRRDGLYKRRADIVLFVNGLPLVFIELKASHKNIENAFKNNFRDYKDTIPHLFWYNSLIIVSNGRQSRIGSITADWEHFYEWKRISDEKEQGRVSLETMLEGTCDRSRLLDLLENFTLYKQVRGGLIKVIAQNHQYLGVNNGVEAVRAIQNNHGRLGVFWHTQGSGKSLSMVFLSQKVMRKLPGNWTFLIVTDREELDDQIYKEFSDVGAVKYAPGGEESVQAQSGEDLKQLLRNDNRYVFTLIQKFHTRDGQPYPILSTRNDIIVITDEAHRSQYDTFAANMRAALPNAAFIGFTGTPLMAGEELTKQVFGVYVSVYNFKQSVDDGATVPLFYENRIPRLELTNEQLNSEMAEILDSAMLDETEENRVEQQFKQEYQVITRDKRQETIAQDIVDHYLERGFTGRGYQSKAMVVSIDKLTAVNMCERVKRLWNTKQAELDALLRSVTDADAYTELEAKIEFMRRTDMAVVISQSQNEIADFQKHGIDIIPHRQRIVREGLDEKFKNPENPLRIVFVCAMWMTGFNVPSCATIYLDKPMRNHTLMQTIARANRVHRTKQEGLIVDYIGIFRNLEQALAIYGTSKTDEEEQPIKDKKVRVDDLSKKVEEARAYCLSIGINLDDLQTTTGFDREALKLAAVEAVLASEDTRTHFAATVRDVSRLFRSILPDPAANEYYATYKVLNVIAETVIIETSPEPVDTDAVYEQIGELLDRSVQTESYVIEADPTATERRLDLSQIDFDALKEQFAQGHRRAATEKLKTSINRRLNRMVQQNRTRIDFQETFRKMLEEYNSGAVNADVMFERLFAFVHELDDEEKRSLAEHLSEEELAVFDLLIKPELNLNDDDRAKVKAVAKELLDTLKSERLVLDWRKYQTTRAAVKESIRVVLDNGLPNRYDATIYLRKVEAIYQHIYESYYGEGQSVYIIS